MPAAFFPPSVLSHPCSSSSSNSDRVEEVPQICSCRLDTRQLKFVSLSMSPVAEASGQAASLCKGSNAYRSRGARPTTCITSSVRAMHAGIAVPVVRINERFHLRTESRAVTFIEPRSNEMLTPLPRRDCAVGLGRVQTLTGGQWR
jgi:hypothetical protein